MIFQIGFVIFAFMAICFVFGHYVISWAGGEKSVVRAITYGFVWCFALFEILALLAFFTGAAFSTLVLWYGIFQIPALFVGVICFVWKRGFCNYKFVIEKRISVRILFGVMVLLIGGQAFLSSYLNHADADDGYFIAISNIALEQNKIQIDGDIVYNGSSQSLHESVRPEVAAWELFIALIAKVSNMHPAILAHTVLPLVLIPLCYMAVLEVAKRLFRKREHVYQFMIAYALLNLFGGYTVFSSGCFLLLRIWQGKAMLVNFAFPLLLANCVVIYKKKESIKSWVLNLFIVIFGVGSTVVGLYLMPIFYLVTGLPYIILCMRKRHWKRCREVLLKAFVTMAPVVFLLLYNFIQVMNSVEGQNYSKVEAPDWTAVFQMTMMQGSYFILFLASLFYLLFRGERKLPTLIFGGMTAGIFLTFLNPLFCSVVSQKITGVDVYWRLYWVMPIYLTIAYAVIEHLKRTTKGGAIIALAMLAGILYLSGTNIYKENLYFEEHQNIYKIPEEGVQAAKVLLDEQRQASCLLPADLSFFVRQYSSYISVPEARGMEVSGKEIGNTGYDYKWLYDRVYNQNDIFSTEVQNALETLEIDFVYSREDLGDVEGKREVSTYGWLYPISLESAKSY